MSPMMMKPKRGQCDKCGGALDEVEGGVTRCRVCKRRSRDWQTRKTYVVVGNSAWVRMGGHFDRTDFLYTLHDFGWPSGMLVEEWTRGKYVRTCRVHGDRLWVVQGAQPIGDGKWLLT